MPARSDSALAPSGDGTTVVRTVCPRNCYCTCGMVVTLEGGRITRIEGDPENSATAGHVCLKGISYARRVTTSDRLLHPMKRKVDGSFARVSWDEALADIASRLDCLRREHGPESVLYYDASGSHGALGRLAMAFWHQFGGCTLTYGDLCWPAGLEATRLTYGANLHNHPRLTADSRFILLWGHNPAETNVHQMRWIHEAQERGATVALIDPRSTDTSDAADIHLQPRPGTDAALALGMARVIVDGGLHDTAFLERHAVGVERYLDRLQEYPLARVAAITGLHELDIARLAVEYARAKPALLIAGFGLQRHHHAGQAMRAVSLLAALTGNIGVAGGGWQYANLASHCLKDVPLPPEPPRVRRAAPVSRLGPALAELDAPRIAGAWVEKGNPVSQNPRSGLVREAFERLDLLVVVDQFMTDTARLAHYVLPAKTMFEEEDLVTAYWHPYLQRRAKLWDPPGEVKTETEIWRLLSERLGADTRYFPQGDAETRELLMRMLPDFAASEATLKGCPTVSAESVGRPFRVASDTADTVGRPFRVAESVGQPFRVASDLFDRLSRRPVDPSGAGDIAFADLNFPTPSGKIEFASEEAARLWGVDPVPDYVPLAEGHDSPLAARFPLQLLSCKTRDRIHSQFGNLDWVRDVERPHRLDMHPSDAEARGLAEGDVAVVWNDRGRIALDVQLDDGLRPGVVHVLEGRCHEGDPDINQLTDAGVTDINHGATFYECLVEVAREDGAPRHGVAAARGQRTVLPRPARTAAARDEPPVEKPAAPAVQNGFLLDLGRCVGCGACVLACRLENGWPAETPWRRVLPLNLRRRPGGPTYFLSVACHHCEHPACLAACPSRAYEKRPDGTVVHHADRCIGCRYCEMACPFGAPQYDAASGVMTKCDFCQHEVGQGFSLASVGRGFSLASVGRGFSLASVGRGFSLATREATLKGRPTGGGPACVAACPTEALRALPAAAGDLTRQIVPGFADPAGCGPNIRFIAPRGRRRAALYEHLRAVLRRRG
jgi:anaerobic selenocysteine-containing dehydrogenase/Fe-S-cluster-containing dehydrogenase component